MTASARTRFAPSPTGELHLGHAFSAHVAAIAGNGKFVLRIDDIDHTRCKPEFVTQIQRDLEWLGLSWHQPIVRQSDRLEHYHAALETLQDMGLVYPCYLTRTEINALLSAPHGNDKALVDAEEELSDAERQRRAEAGEAPAWRLRTREALAKAGDIYWWDCLAGQQIPVDMSAFGDVVVARKDIGTSYHLSVVVDDAMDNVTMVTRGSDLASSTHVHRLLQALLNLPSPAYLHHELVTNTQGKRLAKRDNARSIAAMRDSGMTPADIFKLMPEARYRTKSLPIKA